MIGLAPSLVWRPTRLNRGGEQTLRQEKWHQQGSENKNAPETDVRGRLDTQSVTNRPRPPRSAEALTGAGIRARSSLAGNSSKQGSGRALLNGTNTTTRNKNTGTSSSVGFQTHSSPRIKQTLERPLQATAEIKASLSLSPGQWPTDETKVRAVLDLVTRKTGEGRLEPSAQGKPPAYMFTRRRSGWKKLAKEKAKTARNIFYFLSCQKLRSGTC